jgi:hypothetical protein
LSKLRFSCMITTICWIGEPAIGETVLTGTGGDGDTTIEAPHPTSPASSQELAAAKIAIDTPMHRRGPTRDLRPLTGLALVLDTFPNCLMIQAQRYARFPCTHVILLTRLHFRDISSERRRAFGVHIPVTLVAAEAPSIPADPQQLAVGRRRQPRFAFSERTRTLKAPVPFWAGPCRDRTAQDRTTACPSCTRLAIPHDAPYYPQ